MKLSIAIVGLPNVGKSTLFNALLGRQVADASNYPFCTIDPNVGVVEVPDDKLQVLANNFLKAQNFYLKAFLKYPKEEAEKGDFQYHLGEAQYRAGKKTEGLKNLLDGLKLIEKYESVTDSFVYHVWHSGCLMRLGELTKNKKYLDMAQKIIDSDPRLIIRKRQIVEIYKLLEK